MKLSDINDTMLQQLDPQVAIEIVIVNQNADIVSNIILFAIAAVFFWFMYKV